MEAGASRWPAVLGAALALLLAGCSDAGTVAPDSTPRPPLTVSAAPSLRDALTSCASQFTPGRLRLRFGAADRLAALLRTGPRPDVVAAADAAVPADLARRGLLQPPEVFASDELVLAVPKSGDVGEVADLAKPGATLAVGAAAGALGASTRQVLRRLPAAEARAILANVGATAPDSAGVVARLQQGAAAAGLAYRSDVEAVKGVKAIELPDQLQPAVPYAAGVVKGTGQPAIAQAFVDDLREGNCHDALLTAGFGEPP